MEDNDPIDRSYSPKVFTPIVSPEEQQATYEETSNKMSPCTGALDVIPIVRKEIELYDHGKAFLLYNVLSPSECEYYINKGEELGFGSVDLSYRKNYRNNDRVVAEATEVSKLIWERVKEHITPIQITKENQQNVGVGYGLEGLWEPVGLNEIWRLCKYKPGGHFAPHFDGSFIRDTKERSMKTFMLYLNGGFEGGSTNFVDESQTLWMDSNGNFRAQDDKILLKILPVPGMAIIFNHQLLHEGAQLKEGVKFIMRSDVMFRQSSTDHIVTDPKETEALKQFQMAERLESEGRAMEAAECYRRAFRLWPPLADAYNS